MAKTSSSPPLYPEANLVPDDNDELIGSDELAQITLFGALRRGKIKVEEAPGSVILRRFLRGEIVCRQGEPGHSAFYLVPTEDMLKLREYQLAQVTGEGAPPDASEARAQELREQIAGLQATLKELPPVQDRVAARAYLLPTTDVRPKASGWRAWLGWGNSSGAKAPGDLGVRSIAVDGPSEIDAATRIAPLHEDELFGEMSCVMFTPRSATVAADRDCFAVEFLRNVLEGLQRDESFRQRMDQTYQERVLGAHLRRLELLEDLSDDELELFKPCVELRVVNPGDVIVEEGDVSDSVYIVRSGLVQVVQNLQASLSVEQVQRWPEFCQHILREKDKRPVVTEAAPAAKKGGAAEILAAARNKGAAAAKAGEVQPAAPLSTTKPSPAEILAAARAKKGAAPSGGAESAPAAASPPASDAPPAKPAGKPASVTDILAAARAKKGASEPPAAPPEEGAAAAPPAKPAAPGNVQDILAAARAAKTRPADATKSAASGETPPPATEEKSAPQKKAAPNVNDILAAARKPKAPAAAELPAAEPKTEPAADQPLFAEPAGGSKADPTSGTPVGWLWNWLPPHVRQAVEQVASGQNDDPRPRTLIVRALNQVARQRKWLGDDVMKPVLQVPAVASVVDALPKGPQGVGKQWTDLDVRIGGRAALHGLFPEFVPSRARSDGPPRIVRYLGRGECFGEMGAVLGGPRSATCICYDHPPDEDRRASSRVELVRIGAADFQRLIRQIPRISQRVDRRIAEYQRADEQRRGQEADDTLLSAPEFRDEGLAQGQKLLLIDLDRCTRCGDCVRACINTHDDGRTRLFLDGPRFDRFLIPSACRQCRDPLCMVGCPVGSIQRGENGEIVIRDWCIGCGLCAKQCPYDSIQMHDIGLVPERAPGWQIAPVGEGESPSWCQKTGSLPNAIVAESPFLWSPDLAEALAARSGDGAAWRTARRWLEPVGFRLDFQCDGQWRSRLGFSLEAETKTGRAEAWLNGEPIPLERGSAKVATANLRRGHNVLCVRLSPAEKGTELVAGGQILRVWLGALPEVGELTRQFVENLEEANFKLQASRAVVCDLCSSLPSRTPACVHECPHAAAMRVDAFFDFPALR